MASTSRAAARTLQAASRTSLITTSRLTARSTANKLPLRTARRGYASGSGGSSSSNTPILAALGLATLGSAGYYFYYMNDSTSTKSTLSNKATEIKQDAQADAKAVGDKGREAAAASGFNPTKGDYQQVYDMIAKLLEEKDEYDDGSYGPVLLRLAWHASGTYDASTGTGGSNGATMRFPPEGDHGANAGLKNARDFLEPVKQKFPWISYSDLWILAAVCSIQEMQGPTVPFRPGRQDRDVSFCTPDGRLPDGSKDATYLRNLFQRMGFNDQELVALSGAHALGRCHTDRSGWKGPWTHSPTVVTNDYFKLLLDEKWSYKKWDGPRQFEDGSTKTLMMLPTDMALVQDGKLKRIVQKYADSEESFFKEFSDVLVKLFELGVPFKTDERFSFKKVAQ